jgi:Ca2+-binding EF-hand superfamily protein
MNKEQLMKKILLKQFVAVIAVGGVCGATASEDAFTKLDRNVDGYISAEESIMYDALYENWSSADTNNDGRIDSAEFSAFEVNDENKENKD